jgi:lipopolysaccharide heptosyltransferase II
MRRPSSHERSLGGVKILLIRLRLIGDVVFTTPIPRALKQHVPGARISYLVEETAAPVVAGNPFIDELIVIRRSRGLRRVADDVALARRLRRARYDLVLDLHGGPRGSWLTLATGAPRRIGYAVAGRSWMYTTVVDRPRELRARHSVVNQWDLLEAIPGWPTTGPDRLRNPVEMEVDPAAAARVAARLASADVTSEHDLVVAHVSASNPFKRWPEPAFAEVFATLARQNDRRRIVICSGPSDHEAAARVTQAARAQLGAEAPRIVDIGDFTLPELHALIARSRLFIGGDTGPMHLAATTRTPVVGLFGPTLPAAFAPWRDPGVRTISLEIEGLPCRPCEQRVCAPGDFRCLATLPPARVVAAAEEVLQCRT